ncbi:MAG: hypothetical protein QOJ15_1000 [Bradyrhizobium sp.]|nr:hypothetical protein [Bradyrhizobium sp.]
MAGLDITISVANHDAPGEIYVVCSGGGDQEARSRLAAGALVMVVMRAHEQVVERQATAQLAVEPFDVLQCLRSSSDVGLVRDDDQAKPRLPQRHAGIFDPGQDGEVVDRLGWMRYAIQDDRTIEDAVTVKKDRLGAHVTTALPETRRAWPTWRHAWPHASCADNANRCCEYARLPGE